MKKQYEASPYPRWVNLKLRFKPASVSNVISKIKLKTFDNKIRNVKAPDILIAGCGTGQQSIEIAINFGMLRRSTLNQIMEYEIIVLPNRCASDI